MVGSVSADGKVNGWDGWQPGRIRSKWSLLEPVRLATPEDVAAAAPDEPRNVTAFDRGVLLMGAYKGRYPD